MSRNRILRSIFNSIQKSIFIPDKYVWYKKLCRQFKSEIKVAIDGGCGGLLGGRRLVESG